MNNTQLHHCWVEEEIKKIKVFLELTENIDTTYPNLWETLKAVLRGKFIALSAHMKKLENSHSRELTEQLKSLEQKDTKSPWRSRSQEIIRLGA